MKKAKKKFKASPFKKWLHHIAGVSIKTRDDFTCQWQASLDCLGGMVPGDAGCHPHHIVCRDYNIVAWDPLNLICLCSKCHALAEKQSLIFGMWFEAKYPNRAEHIAKMLQLPTKTWRQVDFEREEYDIIVYSMDINIDYLHIAENRRVRYKRKVQELKGKL